MEDYVLHKPQTLKLVKNEYFWHVIPLPIVYKYVQDKEKITQIKRLVKENKVCHSLYYKKDLGLKRLVCLLLRDFNQYRKYKRHLGGKD